MRDLDADWKNVFEYIACEQGTETSSWNDIRLQIMNFVLSPWLVVNIVFFGMVRIIHLYYLTSSAVIIPWPDSLDFETAIPDGIRLHDMPEMLMLTALLLFVATLVGECANEEQVVVHGVPVSALFSIGFSGVSLAYTALVFAHLQIL